MKYLIIISLIISLSSCSSSKKKKNLSADTDEMFLTDILRELNSSKKEEEKALYPTLPR